MKPKKKPPARVEPLFDAAEELGATRTHTSVKALQKGRVCGWCGKAHAGLKCP